MSPSSSFSASVSIPLRQCFPLLTNTHFDKLGKGGCRGEEKHLRGPTMRLRGLLTAPHTHLLVHLAAAPQGSGSGECRADFFSRRQREAAPANAGVRAVMSSAPPAF